MPGKSITRHPIMPRDFVVISIDPGSRNIGVQYQPRIEGFEHNYQVPVQGWGMSAESDPIIAELVDRLYRRLALGANEAEGITLSAEELAAIDQQIADVRAARAPFALGDQEATS